MEVVHGLIPGMLLLGLAAVAVLSWAAGSSTISKSMGGAS
jgi:hypothetical protein